MSNVAVLSEYRQSLNRNVTESGQADPSGTSAFFVVSVSGSICGLLYPIKISAKVSISFCIFAAHCFSMQPMSSQQAKQSDFCPVFVTGGTGLVGSHLLVKLHRAGCRIRALVRRNPSFTQLELVCGWYEQSFRELFTSVEWVYGDTLDFVALCEQMKGMESVFHCAAVVSFNSKNSEELIRTNVQGTSNVVDAALACGVSRFCFISSIAALGSPVNDGVIDEDTPWKNDGKHSIYAESKFRSELEVWRGANEGLQVVILNPGIVLGPGCPDKGSLLLFQTVRKGMSFYTKGVTGYVDVRDVCDAALLLMSRLVFGRRFVLVSENLDNKRLFSLIAMGFQRRPPRFLANSVVLEIGAFAALMVGRFTGKTPQLTRETARSAQKMHQYSNRRIKEVLNFSFIPIEQTVRETCAFLKANGI